MICLAELIYLPEYYRQMELIVCNIPAVKK